MGGCSKYPKIAGIYKLTCNDNKKIYIGKAVNLSDRLGTHRRCEKKTKGDYYFENAIIKHGWSSFNVEILETFKDFDKNKDKLALAEKEAYYIKLFNSTDNEVGYNICKYSTDTTGVSLLEEHKEKIRQSMLGSTNRLGTTHSEDSKDKIRRAMQGKTNHMGKSHSEESKEKMRQARLGTRLSKETIEKIRQGNLGKTISEETKTKMRKARNKQPARLFC